MKLIRTYFTVCMCLCAVSLKAASDQPFAKADSLFAAGEVVWGLSEYERVCYETSDNVVRTLGLIKKSDRYSELGRTVEAENTLKRILYFALPDSLIFSARYKSATLAFVNKNFEQGRSELLMVEKFLPHEYMFRCAPLHALLLNELRMWDEAKLRLHLFVDHHPELTDSAVIDSLHTQIDELYKKRKQPRYRDPERALVMASIVPGSPQLLAGYPLDALFTTVMVLSGLGVAAYGIFVVKYYASGFILGTAISQRFLAANQKRAQYLVKKRNYLSKRKYNERLSGFILSLP